MYSIGNIVNITAGTLYDQVVQSLSHVLPQELQHTRLPCPSPTPGVYSDSCLLSRWCHPAISFSVVPFFSCLQQTFVGKVMSLLFNMLFRLVITFLPRSKHLLISWLQSPSAVILEPKKVKFVTVSTVSSSIWHEVMGPDGMILVFWMLNFNPGFSLSSFTFIKRLFSSSLLFAKAWCHLHI